MEVWEARKLDHLGFVSRGRSRHRPRNDSSLYGGPYPFFQTGDIKAAEFYLSKFSQSYNEKGLAQSKLWKPGTLCITIAANIAETAVLQIEGCFPDSVVGFVPDPQKADVRFIKYSVDLMKLRMQNISRGTTQDNLSVDKLLSFDFIVPSVDKQREIADVISAYDLLIENNTRRIKTLEEMVQTLYREWFVHLRFPGHESIPLVPSSLGLIPEGWAVTDLESVCVENHGIQTGPFGSQLHKSDYSPQGVPVIMPKDLIDFRICIDSISRIPEAVAEDLSRHRMRPGDIVYGRRGDIGRRAYIMPHQAGWFCGTGCLRIRPEPTTVNGWYLFNYLGRGDISSLIAGRAHGATMPNLNTGLMASVPIAVPPSELQERFAFLTFPIAQWRETLIAQIENLLCTRDLLLPKLISGEVETDNLTS